MAKKKESPKTVAPIPVAGKKNVPAPAAKPTAKPTPAKAVAAKPAAAPVKPVAKSKAAEVKSAAKPVVTAKESAAKGGSKAKETPKAAEVKGKPKAAPVAAPKPVAKAATKTVATKTSSTAAKAAAPTPKTAVTLKTSAPKEAPKEKTSVPAPEEAKNSAAPAVPSMIGGRPKAVVKSPANQKSAQAAERQAKIEADKAARAAALQALTEARLAKAAEVKAAIEAKKAERAAAIKAEADARVQRLAEIKAANAAKAASKVNVSKPVTAAKVTRPEKPATSSPAPKTAFKAAAVPAFEVGLSLRLDPKWDLVMQNALRDAAKSVSEQLEAQLKINPEADLKTRRILENEKRRFIRIIDRAISGALTRLLEPSDLVISQFYLNAEATRLVAPSKALAPTAFAKAKIIAAYKDLVAMISQANSPIHQFGLKKPELMLNFGDSMANDYFLSGSFKLQLNFEKPGATTVEQQFHLFAKRGKTLGVQMKVGFTHEISGNGYAGKLEVDFPVAKADA